ncbi:MAG: hypothetical protein J0M12_12550 [Deltaproteobacteria bacterium]|nr:hypothetical protein [Deltaproteobacteria bacterium]
MNTRRLSSIAFASALGTLGVALACCSGGTGNNDTDFSGGQFVGSGSATGSITINVLDSDLGVSETSGFGVSVKNAQGGPVAGIKVSCDSEKGVAILEPTTGGEITSSSGDISGVIGCAAPGSYQLACRLPVGANKRQLVDIKCRGPIPTGFTGFPDAAGGGLGGGSDDSDSGGVGGTDTDGIRIANLYFDDFNTGFEATGTNFSIDTQQKICTRDDGDGTQTPPPTPVITLESFFDTVLRAHVINNTNQAIQFTQMRYTVLDGGSGTGNGTDPGNFSSSSVTFVGQATAVEGGGGEGDLSMLAIQAVPGATIGPVTVLEKRFVGASENIDTGAGFMTMQVTLFGTNDIGDDIQVSASMTLDFAPFDRCANAN